MKLTVALGAVALACVFAPMAFANGGGGGMSSPPPAARAPGSSTPSDPQTAYRDGVHALTARNYPEAIRLLRIADRAVRNNMQINYALGLAYLGNGDSNAARDALQRAVRDADAPPDAHAQLGMIYVQLNDRPHAIEQQAELQRQLTACDAACGDTKRGQLQTALNQVTQALEPAAPAAADPATTGWNFPSEGEGRQAYAEAVGLINQERYSEALVQLARAQAAVGPQPDVLNYMGFASRKMGRLDTALGYYQQALAINPNHLGANEYLGELYIQMGRYDLARTQLARLDDLCAYGCIQREELAHWIETSAH